jgi:hypothetical protein
LDEETLAGFTEKFRKGIWIGRITRMEMCTPL